MVGYGGGGDSTGDDGELAVAIEIASAAIGAVAMEMGAAAMETTARSYPNTYTDDVVVSKTPLCPMEYHTVDHSHSSGAIYPFHFRFTLSLLSLLVWCKRR